MGFLGKLSSIILKITEIAAGVGPILGGKAQQVVGAVADKLEQIGEVVQLGQVFGDAVSLPLSGPEKLKGVTPAVAQIILKSTLVAGKEIADPELFKSGSQQIAAGVADVLRSLKAEVKTSNPQDA